MCYNSVCKINLAKEIDGDKMQTEELKYVKVSKKFDHKGMIVTLPKRNHLFGEEYLIKQAMIDHGGCKRPYVSMYGTKSWQPTQFVVGWSYFDVLLEHYFIPEFGKCLLMVETKVTEKKCSEACQGANMSSKCTCACGRTNHGGAVDRFGNLQIGMLVSNEEESLVMNYKWYDRDGSIEDSEIIADLLVENGGSLNPKLFEVNI